MNQYETAVIAAVRAGSFTPAEARKLAIPLLASTCGISGPPYPPQFRPQHLRNLAANTLLEDTTAAARQKLLDAVAAATGKEGWRGTIRDRWGCIVLEDS